MYLFKLFFLLENIENFKQNYIGLKVFFQSKVISHF